MKNLLLLLCLTFSLHGFSQTPADPATSQGDVQDPGTGSSVPANNLISNQIVNFVLPIYNNAFTNSIPATSMKVSISLGSNMIVDPTFNIANIGPFVNQDNTNPYFTWTQTILGGGVVKLTGILNQTLPNNYPSTFTLLDQAVVRVKATTAGSSSFQCNVIVNDPSLLSDTDPTNNHSSLNYTVTATLPITYTQFNATQSGCDIKTNWSIANEININRYEVEASKSGTDFLKVAVVPAINASDYSAIFALTDQTKAPSIFVRVKAIDRDGTSHYSDVKTVSGNCDLKPVLNLYVYPNPAVNSNNINIVAKQGSFSGKYMIALIDHTGKTINMTDVQLDNVRTYNYMFNKNLSSGKYLIKIAGTDGHVTTLEFEKL